MRPDQNAVFIAYARADAQFVLELATSLRRAGASLWVDQLDIPPGTHWDQNVEEALGCCARVLVVLSPASVASQNVLDEVSFALEAHKEIIPVLHQPCLIPLRLKRLQYIDLTGNYELGFRRLLNSLGVGAPRVAEPAVTEQEPIKAPAARMPEPARKSARLQLFGGVSLEGERGPIAGRGAQRRRLALLAILAATRRGSSRDKLIGYLWEEADTERARRVLSEAIYVIRKSLGEDAVLTSGDEVRLNPQVVWSDVAAFTDAIESDQLTRAVELYHGPFLDGFFISEALEFDQWAERERDRFARAYADALQRLAAQAETTGDFRAATRWWRKLTEHDKYGAAAAIGLMRALDAAGDRAAALQESRAYTARMRTDLEAEPDAQIEVFAQLLRQAPPRPLPERVLPVARTVSPELVAPPPSLAPAADAPPAATPGKPARRKLVAALGLVLVVALVIILWPRPAPPASLSLETVAVLPFDVRGPDAALAGGLAFLLSNNLDGAGELRAVDPHAVQSAAEKQFGRGAVAPLDAARLVRRFDANHFVLASAVQGGGGATVTLTARMYDVTNLDQQVATGSSHGLVEHINILVDSLSTALLANRNTGASQDFRKTAASTATSWAALKHLVTGDQHFRAGRYDSAVAAFTRAVQEDPQFALAHYRLSAAAEWNFDFLKARLAADDAVKFASRLSEYDQIVLTAWVDFLAGHWDRAARGYGIILANYPIHVEAQYGLAEVLVHSNPIRGEPIADAKPAFDRLLTLVPEFGEARYHLLEFAARERDGVAFDSLFRHLPRQNPQHLAWRAVRAFTFGNASEQNAILSELDSASNVTIGIAAVRLAAHAHEYEGSARIARKLFRLRQADDYQAGAHIWLAMMALANGDWRKTQQELALAEPLERDWTRELSALFVLHPAAGSTTQQILAERERLKAWTPQGTPATAFFFAAHLHDHDTLRLYLLGLLSAAGGDKEAAQAYRNELTRTRGRRGDELFSLGLARSLDGHIALANGDSTSALTHLLAASFPAWPEKVMISPFYSRVYDRWTLLKIYRKLGPAADAAKWERSLSEGYTDFVWPVTVPPAGG